MVNNNAGRTLRKDLVRKRVRRDIAILTRTSGGCYTTLSVGPVCPRPPKVSLALSKDRRNHGMKVGIYFCFLSTLIQLWKVSFLTMSDL